MTKILDGRAAAAAIRSEVAAGVRELAAQGGRAPGLAVVLVGDDPASQVYVGSKTRACEEVGIASSSHRLPATTTEVALAALLDRLNADPSVDAVLVQLPLPAGLPTRRLLERVDPGKDVDGFHPANVGRLWLDEPGFVPCTPAGIVELLRRNGVELVGRRAVVVGRSAIVGKPMAALLLREHCTVTVAHSRTRDLAAVCRQAEILVAAIGKAGAIGPDHVAPGAIVVDVGMNRVTDRAQAEYFLADAPERLASFAQRGQVLVGDVDYQRVAPLASAITPVPGGVGPLTVAMLLANTLGAAQRHLAPPPSK